MTVENAISSTGSSWIKSTCPYCGVGCGIEARGDGRGRFEIRGDKQHPANYGALCSKGLALGETLVEQGRLRHPKLNGLRTDWDTALDTVAGKLRQTVAEHGPESVAVYLSGQLLTEDYYVANKFMKGFIGSAHVDSNSRLCMASSVAGHKRAFGTDTVPGCYADLDMADLLVLTGSNLAWCHPVLYQRIKAAKQRRAGGPSPLKVVVIDPRVTPSCDIADLHLAINPGADVALFNGLLDYLATHQVVDERYIAEHTQGFETALHLASKEQADSTALCQRIGVPDSQLAEFFAWFAQTNKVVTLYSQGVNQSSSGTDKVNSIINCHLATGRIGKPGAGPFSVTGQPNAMGGREVGALANTLAAHMEFGNPHHHQLIRDFWQAPRLVDQPGLKAVALFDAIYEGKIKAVWIMGTNPVVSMPDADKVKAALEKCPLVIVSDCIEETDTNRCADVLLPAQGWSEKSGTVTNSERRISRQRRFNTPVVEARPDWQIICQVARRMGFGDAFNYQSEAGIFAEHAAMTTLDNQGRRDLDLRGLCDLDEAAYQQLLPQQWPVYQRQTRIGHQRLFGSGRYYTPSGKAQLVAVSWRQAEQQPCQRYPLNLNTGRIRDQWHTMTRSGLSPRLSAHLSEPFVTVHPADAQRYGLQPGQLATVNSAFGRALVRVETSDKQAPGQVFMPIHWSAETASHGRVGSLVSPAADPHSGQPELKITSVALTPWPYQSEALLLSDQLVPGDTLAGLGAEYWVKQQLAGGYLYRIASQSPPDGLAAGVKAFCRTGAVAKSFLGYEAPLLGAYRYGQSEPGRLRRGCVVGPTLQGQDFEWLQQLLNDDLKIPQLHSLLLGKPLGSLGQGKIVCACQQVGKKTLCQAIKQQQLNSIEALSRSTGAGTGCGSCVGELQQLLDEVLVT